MIEDFIQVVVRRMFSYGSSMTEQNTGTLLTPDFSSLYDEVMAASLFDESRSVLSSTEELKGFDPGLTKYCYLNIH